MLAAFSETSYQKYVQQYSILVLVFLLKKKCIETLLQKYAYNIAKLNLILKAILNRQLRQ